METYPIRIGGKETGTLQVCREGMYTVFRGKSECSGELIRLSVFGDGKSGYLGVMVPDGSGCATLTRRLSPAAMCDFPETIEYAGLSEDAPICCPCQWKPETPPCVQVPPAEIPPAAEPEPDCPSPSPCPVKDNGSGENAPMEGTEDGDILWYACPDGTLTTFDGRRNLIAFPAGDVRVPRGAEGTIRMIGGKKYIIFPE